MTGSSRGREPEKPHKEMAAHRNPPSPLAGPGPRAKNKGKIRHGEDASTKKQPQHPSPSPITRPLKEQKTAGQGIRGSQTGATKNLDDCSRGTICPRRGFQRSQTQQKPIRNIKSEESPISRGAEGK